MSEMRAPSKTGVAMGMPLLQIVTQLEKLILVHARDLLVDDLVAVDLAQLEDQRLTRGAGAAIIIHQLADLLPEVGTRPAQMRLQDLADVHARRHAQRVQHDIHGVPSSRNGMSSIGTTRDTTPLLPWRPAILSPG